MRNCSKCKKRFNLVKDYSGDQAVVAGILTVEKMSGKKLSTICFQCYKNLRGIRRQCLLAKR